MTRIKNPKVQSIAGFPYRYEYLPFRRLVQAALHELRTDEAIAIGLTPMSYPACPILYNSVSASLAVITRLQVRNTPVRENAEWGTGASVTG